METTIDQHIHLFSKLNNGRCDFLKVEDLQSAIQSLIGISPQANSLLTILAGSSDEEYIDFLDFYIICMQNESLSCYRDFEAVHAVIMACNDVEKPVIAIEQLQSKMEQFHIECEISELEELILAFFGPGKSVLNANDILQILDVFRDIE